MPLSSDYKDILAKLSLKMQHQLSNIPAFFEGIALYQTPEIGTDLSGNKIMFLQVHGALISNYVQSNKLAALDGLAKAFCTSDYYNQQQLANHLDELSDSLRDTRGVGIELSANKHAIAI